MISFDMLPTVLYVVIMNEIAEIIEIWQHFQETVGTLQQPMSAELPLTPRQTTECYAAIEIYFDQQMRVAPEYPLPSAVAGKMRSYTTEIHRLLKLIQRDLIFWHSARQPATKAQRRLEILRKLDMTMQFSQSMIEELNISGCS
jgi:hypothetical protein